MLSKFATAAACGLALIATPALADSGYVPSATVTFKDLDLSTAEGQAELDRRIENAARVMCELDRKSTGTRIASRASKQCYNTALKTTKKQVAKLVAAEQRGG